MREIVVYRLGEQVYFIPVYMSSMNDCDSIKVYTVVVVGKFANKKLICWIRQYWQRSFSGLFTKGMGDRWLYLNNQTDIYKTEKIENLQIIFTYTGLILLKTDSIPVGV